MEYAQFARAAAACEKVTLVCDNLNTHTKGAFYDAFDAEQARAYIKRIQFCYTPKHGSWLNVAECELSCLTSQYMRDRRIGELTEATGPGDLVPFVRSYAAHPLEIHRPASGLYGVLVTGLRFLKQVESLLG